MDIYREISKYLHSDGTVNVLIAGQTCSGKTTLANKLRNCFSDEYSVTIVSQDDYFKNIDDIPYNRAGFLMESPDAFHVSEFKQDVETLLCDSVVYMPNYDIKTNTRIDKQKAVNVGQLNIFEGLHVISLLDLPNCLQVYLDTPPTICLERRIARDTKLLKVCETQVRNYWYDCIQPTSEKFIYPQMEKADILLWRW